MERKERTRLLKKLLLHSVLFEIFTQQKNKVSFEKIKEIVEELKIGGFFFGYETTVLKPGRFETRTGFKTSQSQYLPFTSRSIGIQREEVLKN